MTTFRLSDPTSQSAVESYRFTSCESQVRTVDDDSDFRETFRELPGSAELAP